MTADPTPQPPDHGAAGFCTGCAQAPDERTATVARVLHEHRLNFGPDDNGECCQAGDWTEGNGDVALEDHQAAAVVAALGEAGAGFWPALAGQNDRDAWTFMAERDAARAALDRVRALADELDTPPGPSVYTSDVAVVRREVAHQVANRIRAALDPEEPR